MLLGLRPRAEVVHAANNACNGAVELCDRPFNKIVFPGAHNAMGAATNPNWLFPNQDLDVAKLLDRGVRAFLLDPYRGNRMGRYVRTDFDAVPHANRKIAEVIGQEAWNAGMRIRERLTGEPGPSDVYLCHGFCEMGAIPFEDALRVFVEFLVTHPEEVVIISFEDYVPPADIAAAFEASGLIDFVYRGPLGPSWPTLGEMPSASCAASPPRRITATASPAIKVATGLSRARKATRMAVKPKDGAIGCNCLTVVMSSPMPAIGA